VFINVQLLMWFTQNNTFVTLEVIYVTTQPYKLQPFLKPSFLAYELHLVEALHCNDSYEQFS